MRKLPLALLALLLVGAGCLQSNSDTGPATTTGMPPRPQAQLNTGAPSGSGQANEINVSLEVGNFFFAPTTISAAAGQTVNVTVTGAAGSHMFVIDEINLQKPISTGATFSFVAPAKPGRYKFYCNIGSHRAMGMEGTLVVK